MFETFRKQGGHSRPKIICRRVFSRNHGFRVHWFIFPVKSQPWLGLFSTTRHTHFRHCFQVENFKEEARCGSHQGVTHPPQKTAFDDEFGNDYMLKTTQYIGIILIIILIMGIRMIMIQFLGIILTAWRIIPASSKLMENHWKTIGKWRFNGFTMV